MPVLTKGFQLSWLFDDSEALGKSSGVGEVSGKYIDFLCAKKY